MLEAGDVTDDAGELLHRAAAVVPRLAGRADRCIRPMPADGYPIVERTGPGRYVAVTHSGVMLAPHLARPVARELLDGDEVPELTPYRPARFS